VSFFVDRNYFQNVSALVSQIILQANRYSRVGGKHYIKFGWINNNKIKKWYCIFKL